MTDTDTRGDDPRQTARRAAAAHTAAVGDVESFLRNLPEVPEPAHIAEYANLLTREERTRADRQTAVDALGLIVDSLGSG